MPKVAINGLGRIGRAAFKIILKKHPDLEIVAVNDLAQPEVLAHLLRYDSVYGIYENRVRADGEFLLVDGVSKGRKIRVFSEKDPILLPWKELKVDLVLECTGLFRDRENAEKHLKAGAQKVIISAPSKTLEIPSYVIGVNHEQYSEKEKIVDIGSCTTNCLAPIAKVLNDNYGIKKGFMTTIHSYTNDQNLLDLPHSDLRRARAAAVNIIPTTTGAASAIGKVIPALQGKIDGISLRVPTPAVSVLDFFCELEKNTTKEEVNYLFKKTSQKKEYSGILGVEDAPMVSSDYVGSSFSAVIDSDFTMVNDNLVKIVAWYDNEWGYSSRLAEFGKIICR
jgi:glyceraldehyde 3-phosphate dehydrogenase